MIMKQKREAVGRVKKGRVDDDRRVVSMQVRNRWRRRGSYIDEREQRGFVLRRTKQPGR